MRPPTSATTYAIHKLRTATIFNFKRASYSHRLHIQVCFPHVAHSHFFQPPRAALSNVYIFRECISTGIDLLHMRYYDYVVVYKCYIWALVTMSYFITLRRTVQPVPYNVGITAYHYFTATVSPSERLPQALYPVRRAPLSSHAPSRTPAVSQIHRSSSLLDALHLNSSTLMSPKVLFSIL